MMLMSASEGRQKSGSHREEVWTCPEVGQGVYVKDRRMLRMGLCSAPWREQPSGINQAEMTGLIFISVYLNAVHLMVKHSRCFFFFLYVRIYKIKYNELES